MKKTKQGVRDLNDIGPRPAKAKKQEPEKNVEFCAHPQSMIRMHPDQHGSTCSLCGYEFDWNGVGLPNQR